MVSRAAFEELSDALEMALGNFKRAQEALDAAVVAHAACDALLAKQAETHCLLLLANKLYREAVLAFLANDAKPASARVSLHDPPRLSLPRTAGRTTRGR